MLVHSQLNELSSIITASHGNITILWCLGSILTAAHIHECWLAV